MHIFGSRRGDIEEANALAVALANPSAAIEMINKLVEAANLNKETTIETQAKIDELKLVEAEIADKEAAIIAKIAALEAEHFEKLTDVERQRDAVLSLENDARRLQGEHQRKIAALDYDATALITTKNQLADKVRELNSKEEALVRRELDLKNKEQVLKERETQLKADQTALDTKLTALRGLAA